MGLMKKKNKSAAAARAWLDEKQGAVVRTWFYVGANLGAIQGGLRRGCGGVVLGAYWGTTMLTMLGSQNTRRLEEREGGVPAQKGTGRTTRG